VRWLLLLVLLTVVWFLAHVAESARRKMGNRRRGLPPETPATASILPGMIMLPLGFLAVAVGGDAYGAPWVYRVVAVGHLIYGAILLIYIAVTIMRLRRQMPTGPGI